MSTFFTNVKRFNYTMLIFQDKDNYKFGAFCAHPWQKQVHTFGSFDNFVFTFKDNLSEPIIYRWTGENEQF